MICCSNGKPKKISLGRKKTPIERKSHPGCAPPDQTPTENTCPDLLAVRTDLDLCFRMRPKTKSAALSASILIPSLVLVCVVILVWIVMLLASPLVKILIAAGAAILSVFIGLFATSRSQ
jgi:hypothetical protein